MDLVSNGRLVAFLEFENEEFLLSRDVDHRVRFCLLSALGRGSRIDRAEFSFGARQFADVDNCRFIMPPEDILLLNPNTGTAPLFRSRRDAEITLAVYRRVAVLWRDTPRSNPWSALLMQGMFNIATDAGQLASREQCEVDGWELQGNRFSPDGKIRLPLYEAKMIHHFDYRYGTYRGQTSAQANMGTLPRLSVDCKRDPSCQVMPRYWVSKEAVDKRLDGRWDRQWILAWRDICRSTDERTLISSAIPRVAAPDGTLLMLPGVADADSLIGNLASFVLDYIVRQKSAGTHLKFYTMKQLPILAPRTYQQPTPWDLLTTCGEWVRKRVCELTYVSWEMAAFADDVGMSGSPFIWDDERRFAMRAELDAAYFHLYGVGREDVGYVMDSFGAFQRNDPDRFALTKALILDVYDAMARAMEAGEPYRTILDPPPGEGPRHPDR